MTAIAGLVGVASAVNGEIACRTSLDALRLYGSRSSIRAKPTAAFGLNFWELLPEDRFDHQPYCDHRFLLVADVRLDNRAQIFAALSGNVPAADHCSDAELLFLAWRRWQERCLDIIVGDYAFAVHDNELNKLFLVRDPMGQRPLFYRGHGGAFFFASMPSGLLAHGRRGYDHVRIAQRLAGEEDVSRRSYYRDIARVLSGETVVVSGDQIEIRRYNPATDQLTGRTDERLIGELREKLDSAVAARLRRTSGIVATHLSSGYDSSAVTATACMLGTRNEISAFTSAPIHGLRTAEIRGRIADESEIAAQTAKCLGIEHEIVRTPQPLLESLRDHTRYYQEPVRNVLNIGWWEDIQRRAAERGANVLLTGEVGNLTLSVGGLTALADWVNKGDWARWWTEAMSAARRPDVRWRGILINSFRFKLTARTTEQLVGIFLRQPRWRKACFVRRELLSQLSERAAAGPLTPADERLRILQGFDAGVARKGTLAKHGIDERDPTADRRLIEFALRLPPESLLRRGTYKPLARAALSDRLPDFVLDLPSRGYQGADWISRINKQQALTMLEEISGNSTVQEVIDLPRLTSAILKWPDAATAHRGMIESFGRHLTNALAMGVFLLEGENWAALGT
jgi:asparagine synthase (glutamine-hydrolysing)